MLQSFFVGKFFSKKYFFEFLPYIVGLLSDYYNFFIILSEDILFEIISGNIVLKIVFILVNILIWVLVVDIIVGIVVGILISIVVNLIVYISIVIEVRFVVKNCSLYFSCCCRRNCTVVDLLVGIVDDIIVKIIIGINLRIV